MIVTVEPPLRLVLGAFVEEGKMKGGAEGVREWGYWEGEFGAQELAAHVSIARRGEIPLPSPPPPPPSTRTTFDLVFEC